MFNGIEGSAHLARGNSLPGVCCRRSEGQGVDSPGQGGELLGAQGTAKHEGLHRTQKSLHQRLPPREEKKKDDA